MSQSMLQTQNLLIMFIQNLQHNVNSSHNTDNTNTFPDAPDTESAHLQHSVNSSHNTDRTNTFPDAQDTESAHLQYTVNSSHNTDNTNTFPGAPDTESAHHAHLEPATQCEQFTQH